MIFAIQKKISATIGKNRCHFFRPDLVHSPTPTI